MGVNSEFFLKFMEPLINGFIDLFKGIGSAIIKIFNIANYFDIIAQYKGDMGTSGTIVIIVAVLALLLLFAIIIFFIYRIIRRFIKYRHNVAHHDELVDQIEELNNEVLKLQNENQKYLNMVDSDEVEYDENGNIINKLGDGESRFFKLSQIDDKYADFSQPEFKETITLPELCERFRNYSASQLGLFYSIDLIRLFIASFSSNRLIILQGISGTGKTSLAHAFGKFVKNDTTIAPVQPSWRDNTELLGYFNEFTKRFNETEVLTKMYEAKYNPQIYLTLLDEMNIARVEYYFAQMLSILELPTKEEWILELVPNTWESDPKLIVEGKISIPDNMWYIGTINNDDSTFMVTDKVYDRAMPINLDSKGVPFDAPSTEALDITANYFLNLLEKAKSDFHVSEENLEKIAQMDDYVIAHFRVAFGNRIVKQLKEFVPTYMACGGQEIIAIDYLVCNKILRKFEQLNLAYIRGEIDGFIEFLNKTFGDGAMTECIDFLERLKKSV